MKDVKTLLLLTTLLFATLAYGQSAKSSAVAAATAAAPQSSASGTPSTPPTIGSAIDREISIVEKELIDAAEAMPEGKFDRSVWTTLSDTDRASRCLLLQLYSSQCRTRL